MDSSDDFFLDMEEFIRSNLSFLNESDDEIPERCEATQFLSHQIKCIYQTAAIDSSVKETWSTLSTYGITSPTETPSKYSNVCVHNTLSDSLRDVPLIKEICESLDVDFMGDALDGHTSTPTKNSNDVEPQEETFRTPEAEQTPSWKLFTQAVPKTIKEAPVTALNMISKLNEKIIFKDRPENITKKSVPKTALPKVEERQENSLDESKSTFTEFLQIPPLQQSPRKLPETNDENKENKFCKFCFKNGELPQIYGSHVTKQPGGVVVCPILRKYVCELCGETGDNAHTRKYCRLNNERFQRKPFFRRLSNGVLTSSHNHK